MSTFKMIVMERKRIEEIVWKRAFDHFNLFGAAKVDCVYGSLLLQIFQSVNESLFHGIGDKPVTKEVSICSRSPWQCAAMYKEKAMRLTQFFYSYATAIRSLFEKHNALLESVRKSCPEEKPCKLPVQYVKLPPIDFSAFVFRHINTVFFHGALRCRNINVPASIVAKVEDKSFCSFTPLYSEWLQRGGWEKAAASSAVCGGVPWFATSVFIPVIDMPLVDPPPVVKESQQAAEPQQQEAEPQQQEAEPQQQEAEPQQQEAEPQQQEAEPQPEIEVVFLN
jgi:hypothetical protein